MPLIRDLAPLFTVHLSLLVATLALVPGNTADIRVQTVWTLFLTLGWLLTPFWLGDHASWPRRYVGAAATSIACHGLLALVGSVIGMSMNASVGVISAGLLAAAAARYRHLRQNGRTAVRVTYSQVAVVTVIVLLAISVYSVPRSNDIYQFMLQQQDMLAAESLQVSSIGTSAMGVDQPMPRWNAHYWHLLPCLLANASGVAVDLVLLRYATIPVAFTVLLCMTEIVRRFTSTRATYPMVLLAITGPVLLWYRNYTAFNYSFRLTNNFLLDKDFALFFLVPVTSWLAAGWVTGKNRFAVPLLALIPALVRFHPLTAVYLLLVSLPLAALLYRRPGFRPARMAITFAGTALLFVAVVMIGDAQSNHEQIRQIIQTDYDDSLNDRPLHYWIGFYNTIRDAGLESDTTAWVDGTLRLKGSLIFGCGLLLAFHLSIALLILSLVRTNRLPMTARVLSAGLLTSAMLWGMWLLSGAFLTRFPHYTAGYERLHWFSYLIALIVTASVFATWIPRRRRRVVGAGVMAAITLAALLFHSQTRSPLVHLRGLHSLLDYELDEAVRRRDRIASTDPTRTLADLKPSFLGDDERVLLLDLEAAKHYWMIRQGVFWPDPYVEAFAFYHRGGDFLDDRDVFYRLLDRQPRPDTADWLREKNITWIVDPRDGGDEFLKRLSDQTDLDLRQIEPGIWRIGR